MTRSRITAATGPFAIVPRWLFDAVHGDPGPILLYLVLWWHSNGNGAAWPGQSRLAAQLHVSDRTVKRWLARLVEIGAVDVDRRRRRGAWTSNHYQLRIEDPCRPT